MDPSNIVFREIELGKFGEFVVSGNIKAVMKARMLDTVPTKSMKAVIKFNFSNDSLPGTTKQIRTGKEEREISYNDRNHTDTHDSGFFAVAPSLDGGEKIYVIGTKTLPLTGSPNPANKQIAAAFLGTPEGQILLMRHKAGKRVFNNQFASLFADLLKV